MTAVPANQLNGHRPDVVAEVEAMPPFEQQAHDLLLASIDRIAEQWVGQLTAVRANSDKVERLVLERVTAVKNAVTQLHLLGAAVTAEAKRGDRLNEQLATELLKLTEVETQQ